MVSAVDCLSSSCGTSDTYKDCRDHLRAIPLWTCVMLLSFSPWRLSRAHVALSQCYIKQARACSALDAQQQLAQAQGHADAAIDIDQSSVAALLNGIHTSLCKLDTKAACEGLKRARVSGLSKEHLEDVLKISRQEGCHELSFLVSEDLVDLHSMKEVGDEVPRAKRQRVTEGRFEVLRYFATFLQDGLRLLGAVNAGSVTIDQLSDLASSVAHGSHSLPDEQRDVLRNLLVRVAHSLRNDRLGQLNLVRSEIMAAQNWQKCRKAALGPLLP
jgi:hypothetical protein